MQSTRSSKSRRQGVRRFRFTREAYERIAEVGVLPPDSRVELINGELIEISRQSSQHYSAIQRLSQLLSETIGPERHVRPQGPISINSRSQPEPDLCVVVGSCDRYRSGHPTSALLVIEVSDTSHTFDSTRKRTLYASAGIPEYWIVNPIEQQIEVYTDPSGTDYHTRRTIGRDGSLAPSFDESVRLSVADVLP